MNLLRWLSSVNEDKQELEPFDSSFVLPLTVGLGTVVVSVLLGYRGGILGTSRNSDTKKSVKTPMDLISSSRELTKRKSIKPTPKPKLSVPSVSKPLPEVKGDIPSTNPRISNPGESTLLNPSDAVLRSTFVSSSKLVSDQQHPTAAPSESKKSKKHKKPVKQDPVPVTVQKEELPDVDATWVTVIPKRMRTSALGSTLPSDTPASSTVQLSTSSTSLKKSKVENSQTSHTRAISDNTEASEHDAHIPPPSSMSSQPSPGGSTSPDAFPSKKSQKTRKTTDRTSTSSSKPSDSPTPDAQNCSSDSGLSVEKSSQLTVSHDGTLNSEAVEINRVHTPSGSSNSPASTLTPAVSKFLSTATHLSAADELHTSHLSAQVEAKEAECQLLRSEIINLREEVKKIRNAAPAPVVKATSDSETMTEPLVDTDSKQKTKSESLRSPTPTKQSAQQRSHSPDSVLLKTLQDEIARLAKEITLSHQRNENLESRLSASTKQVTMAKRESDHTISTLQTQLKTQTQRADQLDEERSRLESQVQDLLQQNEIQRRKNEESEHVSTQQLERVRSDYNSLLAQKEEWGQERKNLLVDKNRMVKDIDLLNTKYSTVLHELDSTRRKGDEIRQQLQDAEIRLQSIDHERTSSTMQSNQRIEQLESELIDLRAREQKAEADIVAAESKATMFASKLDEKSSELARLSDQLVEEQNKVSELERAVNDERAKREQAEFHLADSMRAQTNISPSPVVLENRVSVDATTQSDPEPSAEFEFPADHNAIGEPRARTAADVSVEPRSAAVTEKEFRELELQVADYKSALDVAESMLSKLQKSVSEEEQRWHEALGASKMECELLELKISKLESTVSSLTAERDALNKTVQELQLDVECNAIQSELQSVDSRSSAHSHSIARLADTANYDENTPKSELIRLLNRFRCLVQIEHETVKREQANSAQLQQRLASLERKAVNGTSSPVQATGKTPDNKPSNGINEKPAHPTKLQGAETNGVSDKHCVEYEVNGTLE